MKSILHIAFKYLFFQNKKQAINILSLITMVAMGCGAGALIVILSAFNGLEKISMSLNESFQSDLTILPKKNKQFDINLETWSKINKLKNINHASKTLEEKIYVKYQNGEALATLKGVDSSYFKTNEISKFIVDGDSILETDEYSFGLLGSGIASQLNVNIQNSIEPLSIYFPKGEFSGGLSDNFDLNYITPGGIFRLCQEYDDKYILAPLAFVQYLNNSDENRVSSIELSIKKGTEFEVRNELMNILGNEFMVKNKLELNETFYRISKIEKFLVMLIMIFVLIILSFNFIGSLTMHLIEKSNDLKTLYYIGLSGQNIYKLYIALGMMQGLLGGLVGLVIGIIICLLQDTFGFLTLPHSETFIVQSYPVFVSLSDCILVLIILVFVSFFASIFPALKAKKSVTEK